MAAAQLTHQLDMQRLDSGAACMQLPEAHVTPKRQRNQSQQHVHSLCGMHAPGDGSLYSMHAPGDCVTCNLHAPARPLPPQMSHPTSMAVAGLSPYNLKHFQMLGLESPLRYVPGQPLPPAITLQQHTCAYPQQLLSSGDSTASLQNAPFPPQQLPTEQPSHSGGGSSGSGMGSDAYTATDCSFLWRA